MKTIATFGGGAVLAALLMYFVMSRDKTPAETVRVDTPAATAPEPGTPTELRSDAPTLADNPAAADAPEPSAHPSKPSPMPKREKTATHKPAEPAHKQDQASGNQPPASTQPTTTAQNTPPSSTTGGPMIPYTPEARTTPPPDDPKPAPKREPKTVTVAAGTLLNVRVDQTLSTEKNKAGDSFRASLDQPLVVDGMVIAERGAQVEGRVSESDPGGRVKGVSQLSLELVRLNTSDGQKVRLQTESFAKQGDKQVGKDAAKVGAAAGIGAAIGAIAGGGKGAGIGAIVGGAAGTGGVMATRGAAAQIPAETRLSFRLREPISITERLP